MFRGKFEHTIDEKGRVSVPAKFREYLQAITDDRVVITNFVISSVRCLDVYPHAAWVRLEEALLKRPQFDQRIMRFQNFYFANAHDCVLDKQGRILLPPCLRDYATLTRDVVFTSAWRSSGSGTATSGTRCSARRSSRSWRARSTAPRRPFFLPR